MELEEYFAQGEYYFSESAQEMVPLENLPFPHLFNACKKLFDEYGLLFKDTQLFKAFTEKLSPSRERIRTNLRMYGKASCIHFGNADAVRAKMYGAAQVLGVKVTTHKEKNWITATVVIETQVSVKGAKVGHR